VTARSLFILSGLLLLFASGVYGGGAYQRTKDGKTLIWNDDPDRNNEAIWSGSRDPGGYASGLGTLTWNRVERKAVTGSWITTPRGRSVPSSRYLGKMVRGKLEGLVVLVDATGKTFRGTFVNGSRVGNWSAGPTPTPTSNQRRTESVPTGPVEGLASGPSPTPVQRRTERVQRNTVTEAPAGGPEPTPIQRRKERADGATVAKAPVPTPAPSPDRRRKERVHEDKATEAPAEGPAPTPDQRHNERVRGDAVVEAPTQARAHIELETAPSPPQMAVALAASPRASIPPPPSGSPGPGGLDPIVKNRIIADFKDETQAVLSRVSDSTGNFHEVDRLELVQKLPAVVSENVGSLVERARDFRAKVGYETALQEYRTETETVDALSVVDQVTRNIAANDASAANSRLSDFLKSNPEPMADSQKPLWRYLSSVQTVCSRSEKDADVHLQRAQSLAWAGRNSEAIREYQEAYRIFPNPATAQKIRQLQDNSLGL